MTQHKAEGIKQIYSYPTTTTAASKMTPEDFQPRQQQLHHQRRNTTMAPRLHPADRLRQNVLRSSSQPSRSPRRLTLHHGGQSCHALTARNHDKVNATDSPWPTSPPPPLGLSAPPCNGGSAHPNEKVVTARMTSVAISLEGAPRSTNIN
jgi:hypothetical protein